MQPSDHLRRRSIWINRINRSQALFFKTMEERSGRGFRDHWNCHSHFGPREHKSGRTGCLHQFRRMGQAKRAMAWARPPQIAAGQAAPYQAMGRHCQHRGSRSKSTERKSIILKPQSLMLSSLVGFSFCNRYMYPMAADHCLLKAYSSFSIKGHSWRVTCLRMNST